MQIMPVRMQMRMRGRKQKMNASKTYAQLVVELAELDEEIERARARERVDAIAAVHSLMDTYAIKHRDLAAATAAGAVHPESAAGALSRSGERKGVERARQCAALDQGQGSP